VRTNQESNVRIECYFCMTSDIEWNYWNSMTTLSRHARPGTPPVYLRDVQNSPEPLFEMIIICSGLV
jgi:hypothetical protein